MLEQQIPNNLPGISSKIIFLIKINEDILMRCRGPSFIKRSFKLHRANQQPWYFTAIGVFTMNTYFANSSEVVNIVFFYFRVRIISNGTLEHKRSRLIRSNWFWCAYQGKVLPQSRRKPIETPSCTVRFSNRLNLCASSCVSGKGEKTIRSKLLHQLFECLL